MSRFYLVEFRHRNHKRWHPWKREGDRHAADRAARDVLSDGDYSGRVVQIDTDAMTVKLVYRPAEGGSDE